MLQRAAGRDPLGPLAGDLSDDVEVLVVVEHGEVVDLRDSRDQQVDDEKAMPACVCLRTSAHCFGTKRLAGRRRSPHR